MLDIKLLRERPDIVINDLKRRGDREKEKWIPEWQKLDKQVREFQYKIEQDRKARNAVSLEISKMTRAGKSITFNKKRMADISKRIAENEAKLEKIREKANFYLMRFPNILHESVPQGADEIQNQEIRVWGKIPKFAFKPKSHIDLMESLDLADMERAGKITGARFYFLKNELVLLEQALIRFALEQLQKKGFLLLETPFMIRRKPYEGVVDMADFENVMYKIEGEDLYMIATSEHPMVSMYMGEVLPEGNLPIRHGGISPCFRKEAGTHGKDTKGIFRVHQSNKVEQIAICRPEDSWEEFERLMRNTEEIFQALELPYRVVNVCTGDIGSIAAKKYDLEAWMPAQGKYREVGSCSNCTDYQARRLGIRFGKEGEKPKGLVHTLNNTALATPRTIVAILENFQQKDGSILIPHRLRQHMGGMKQIGPK